ncbi:NLI interacting factor-like phosphatase [Quillaja saponaria]|uniref:Mitochondrial import inner membrane translocase subunit TIM50 n=1 Tax=Quillaja saponaria TaxID=32244 RepID=A0AAD7VHP1_QUISA|nr:NLI interacting factor-like phosphatase [Quillaja saponaria]
MAGKNNESLSHENVVFSDSEDDYEVEDKGIDLGLPLEKLNLGPKKKLLVMSLNGLLLNRIFKGKKLEIPNNRIPDGRYKNHLVFKRPFSEEFMKFCFERFEVGIWSSAMEHNIDGVLNSAMGELNSKLLFVWDQRECTDSGYKSLERKVKPLFFKELKKVWENFRRGGPFSAANTLLIDDKPYKALLNPAHTAVFPESYNAVDNDDDALDPKGGLAIYLKGLADADDVQTYVKEHPFGQSAVTSSHPDWSFYSPILESLGKNL